MVTLTAEADPFSVAPELFEASENDTVAPTTGVVPFRTFTSNSSCTPGATVTSVPGMNWIVSALLLAVPGLTTIDTEPNAVDPPLADGVACAMTESVPALAPAV